MGWPNLGEAHRPSVAGRRGAVASAHPLASLAGLNMLQQGGNAVDAAVAIAAALNVVEPYMSGAAGVGYMTIRVPGEPRPVVLDFTGRAPAAATPDQFAEPGSKDDGIRSPLVPGALAGWLAALERYGTLDRATVFAPAIDYAEYGYPVTDRNYWFMASFRDRLRRWPTSAATYLVNGDTPRPGTLLRQPDLARTFRAIVAGGADVLYRGPIGEEIVRFSQQHGGLLTAEDLATYQPAWLQPVSTSYRGYDVYCPPPPCAGMQYLITLNILEAYDLDALGPATADTIHLRAEAIKLALADRVAYAADPGAPVDALLSKPYADHRRALIDATRAAASSGDRFTSTPPAQAIRPGSRESILRECTTHFVTADDRGYAVSCTQTLGNGFGCAIVHGSTGLALNNFAYWFDLDPASPNVIGPNKRVEMCLAPSQVWRDGALVLALGTPGSFGILQTTPQMLSNVLDHRYSVQAAIEAPRFRTGPGTELSIESRITPDVVADLRHRGHDVHLLEPWTPFVGGGQGILQDPDTGIFWAGADPRRDGYALVH